MSLVIYEAIQESECDRVSGEHSEIVLWQRAPQVGDEVLMGSEQRWKVIHVETYQASNESVYLAMVTKSGESVEQQDWRSTSRREFAPNVAFYINASSDRRVINYGWDMQGEAPSGDLLDYTPTGQGTLMQAQPSSWVVDRVETFSPAENSAYSAIHLSWCVSKAMSIAA
jgi:hypothetical protein